MASGDSDFRLLGIAGGALSQQVYSTVYRLSRRSELPGPRDFGGRGPPPDTIDRAMPRTVSALFRLPRGEGRRALYMLASLFLVITSFWMLKPLRKARFLEHYDAAGLTLFGRTFAAAQAELGAKLVQVALAALLALAFVRLARRKARRSLIAAVGGAFAALFLGLGALSHTHSSAFVWTLYSAGDLYATLMVAVLFAGLHELSTPEAARRSYGVVGLGAVLGGVLGSQLSASLLYDLPLSTWLSLCSALTLGAVLCATRALEQPSEALPGREPEPATQAMLAPTSQPSPTPYVLSLALVVGLYEIISTLLDYQFSATLAHALDGAAIGRQMGRAFALMNITALLVQLFVTTPLMQKHGSQAALLLLPCTLLCASFGMLVWPVVPMASLLPTLDSGFSCSVHQSAKESLYVPLAPEHKYDAKAFVDVVVLRCAKALGLLLCLGVVALAGDAASLHTLSLLTLALVVPFGLCALHAGKRAEPSLTTAARGSVVP